MIKLKLPAAPLKRDLRFAPTSCRESSKCKELIHFIVVRSLTPSASGGLREMRSLEHFQLLRSQQAMTKYLGWCLLLSERCAQRKFD